MATENFDIEYLDIFKNGLFFLSFISIIMKRQARSHIAIVGLNVLQKAGKQSHAIACGYMLSLHSQLEQDAKLRLT